MLLAASGLLIGQKDAGMCRPGLISSSRLGMTHTVLQMGALPADPVCQLALMVEGAMPSAQNLVLLMQLRESTRPIAPRMAQLLLRMYALCVIPVTLWMGVFVGKLPTPLSAL